MRQYRKIMPLNNPSNETPHRAAAILRDGFCGRSGLLFLLAILLLQSCSQARSIARTAERANLYKKQAAQQIQELSARSQTESWPKISGEPELNQSISVKLHTSKGIIEIQLAFQLAPLATLTFLRLAGLSREPGSASYIGDHFRQPEGAAYVGAGDNNITESFPAEYSEWLNFRRAGTLAFSSDTEQGNHGPFIISLAPQPDLFGKFTAFGQIQGQRSLNVARKLTAQDHISAIEAQSDNPEGKEFLRELREDDSKMAERVRVEAPYRRHGLAAIHRKLARDFAAVQWPRHQRQALRQLQSRPATGPTGPTEQNSGFRIGDWGLEYKVTDRGDPGKQPFKQAELQYAVWATQDDGSSLLLEDRIQKQQSVRATPEQLFPALRAGLSDMGPGERRLYVIPPEGAYGVKGKPPNVPPWSYLIMELYLLDIQ
ncbi:peptidylprolyl isomerase [Candidatus Haliotispira prima]|uniref:peptidylprolyl isomerase n=1 Tax=Candidatus Haliotispira prima TaxID=3034016 RepID=A0ABY8MKD9_9SPIO|nr:peptidylprolyl isomerase [Candidatus Haliotispira prima]